MDVVGLRTALAKNMYRRAVNGLPSVRPGSRFGDAQRLTCQMSGMQLTLALPKLGTFCSRSVQAWSTCRTPFLFNTMPLFRPAFRLAVENSPTYLYTGRSYSVRPLRDERLKVDKQQNNVTEGQSTQSEHHPPSRIHAVDSTAEGNAKHMQAAVPFTEVAAERNDAKMPEQNIASDRKLEKPPISSEGLPAKEELHSVDTPLQQTSSGAVEADKPGILKRFQMMYKQYGVVLVGVHVFTSSIWAGIFYYAAANGVNVVPVLQWMGASDAVISPFLLPGVGNAAVTYLMYKLATPVRYTVTIAGTQLAVRYLRHYGYLKQPETADGKKDSLKSLMKDSREIVKDKMGDIREDMHELKDELKDKIEHIREHHQHHKISGGSPQQRKQ